MTEPAVRIERLSKRYWIFEGNRARYRNLREVVTKILSAPFRPARKSRSKGRSQKGSFWALKDVSFDVMRGDVIGVIGSNGAGKTTLLKVLSRITEPTEGRVQLRGRVAALLEVGTGFHPELTGHENIYLNGAILGMRRTEIDAKLTQIVDFADIDKFLHTPVKFYSSGMYMRLAFAVAAHLEQEILVVDEVLAVGDASFQRKCLRKMGDVARGGRTVLFVSHNMAAVSALCTRAVLLKNGRLEMTGKVDAVISRYMEGISGQVRTPISQLANRRGSGKLRFTNVVVTASDAQDSGGTLYSGCGVSVILTYESNQTSALGEGAFVITVSDPYANKLFSCSTNYERRTLDALPPNGTVRCRIASLPLAAGLYKIEVVAYVNGIEADRVPDAAELLVHEADFFKTGYLPSSAKHGPFLVSHSWNMKS